MRRNPAEFIHRRFEHRDNAFLRKYLPQVALGVKAPDFPRTRSDSYSLWQSKRNRTNHVSQVGKLTSGARISVDVPIVNKRNRGYLLDFERLLSGNQARY
uniref:Uncharacterized protein n=1 Tax=Mucochytrium quahogii TaxID=96639 RepID=A0A7S2SJE0_9STRA